MVSIAGLVIADMLASRRGIQDADALNRIRIIGAVVGASPLGIIVSDVEAQRAAQSIVAVPTTTATTTTPSGTTQMMVQVPPVTGMTFSRAESLLKNSGLQAQRQNVIGSKTAQDIVIAQKPPEGETVPNGTVVILSVSLGVLVPDVRNLLLDDATAQLHAIGLNANPKYEPSLRGSKDTVIGQDQPPGLNISPGSTVTLTVSLGANVTVPPVVEKRVAEAQKLLEAAGLQTKLESESNGGIKKGFVIKSNPHEGKSVPLGTMVTLTVSTGEYFELDDYRGQRFEKAQQKLQGLKLHVNREDQTNAVVAEGFVISQKPPAGSQVSPDSQVTLIVSKGTKVDLPNLIDKPYSDARETLQDLDFIVNREPMDSDKPEGTVVDQKPKAGKVAPETQVTLYVSKGPQGPT
jgi:beta-lactam-binding protein with PASTA domain